MNPAFQKLLEKKKQSGEGMSQTQHDAHSSVLADLMNVLGSKGMSDIKGAKKVTIASDSKEGLQAGLDKAKEAVDNHEEQEGADDESMEDPAEEGTESPDQEAAEGQDEESQGHGDAPDMKAEGSDDSASSKDEEIAQLKARLAELEGPKDTGMGSMSHAMKI